MDGRFNIFFLAKDAELIEQALKRFIRADRFKDANQVQAEESQGKSKKTEKVMPINHENDKKSKTAFAYGLGVAINPVENISVNIGYEGTRSKYYDQKMNFNGFNIGVGYKF